MRPSRTGLVLIGAMAWAAACSGQEPGDSDSDPALRERRMELMRMRAVALQAAGPDDEEYLFSEEPILRYNDTPRGVIDASVWALGREGRPRAVLVLEVYDNRTVMYELTASADPPQHVQAKAWRWTPKQGDFIWKQLPVTTPPGNSTVRRRRQIKQLTQNFAASEEFRGQTYHLRLMPQPVYQYEDAERGVLNGAVFVWAHGTNVEILMFIEARQEEGSPPHWVAGFSRLAAASLDVTYQQQDFWSSPQKVGSTPSDAYFSRGEPHTPDERAAFAIE